MVIGFKQLMNKLELILTLKPGKNKEFKQSLQFLREKIEDFSTSFEIDESEDTRTFCIVVRWETDVQMNQSLKSDEFKILSGAIDSLCAKTMIILDDKQIGKQIGKHISGLKSISQV